MLTAIVPLVNKNLFLKPVEKEEESIRIGVWEQDKRFEYTLKVGTYNTNSYLRLMEWQAQKAMKRLFETGKPTVIIHDNASIHRAKVVQQRHQIWSKQGPTHLFSSSLFSSNEPY
ncbi:MULTISPECIES: hypothetical protein [unclassified Moorena]|uniref:hypothetical protein n=1 Tax=unclassified Moorena TaxID=2683338 RepID=UPI0013C9EAFF|nr:MULTISPECIES: hypothetical protein [unclassified Moorena]NEO20164.1 hypothetical protein [Moorena sp. SIO4A5]NEQ59388.1 hypothetical protein [Moorena sp. SIO4A1]